jgi:hypothetical protein
MKISAGVELIVVYCTNSDFELCLSLQNVGAGCIMLHCLSDQVSIRFYI